MDLESETSSISSACLIFPIMAGHIVLHISANFRLTRPLSTEEKLKIGEMDFQKRFDVLLD